MASIEYDFPDDPDGLREWIKSRESIIEDDRSLGAEFNKEIAKKRQEEQEILAQVQAIAIQRREIQAERDALRTKVQNEHALLKQAKKRLEVVNSEAIAQKKLKEESAIFDELTSTAYWREFAFEHQLSGAKRLASIKRGILADKRGLGKTLTSIIYSDMTEAKKVIIFAPKDVLNNFKREIERWAPHRNVAILGGMSKAERETFLSFLSSGTIDQCLLLCNYEAWRKDPSLLSLIENVKFDTVIVDEAHNIKTKSTSAYKGIRQIVYSENSCSQCGGKPEKFRNEWGNNRTRCSECLYEPTEFGELCSVNKVLLMTGTPILNAPFDLWTLLHLVDRELFPSEADFLRNYCVRDSYTNRWTFRYGGEEALTKKLGSMFVARDRESAGVTIPPQTIQRHYIDFDKKRYAEQYQVLEQIRKFGAIKMAEDVKLDVVGVLPELTRRRQAITWPAGIKIMEKDSEGIPTGRILYEAPATKSIKIDKCVDLGLELIEEDRIVIFSQFKEALKQLEKEFKSYGVTVTRYDGDMSESKAQEAQLDFDGKTASNHPMGTNCDIACPNWDDHGGCGGYKYQVILCQYKKGGVGLNLNAARQMIILDREWNPGKEDQAQGRIDRIDNKHETVVHTIHVIGTIDNFMDDLIEEKDDVIQGFESSIDVSERLLAALQDDDLL